ncbi:MAG: hypothetical protein IJN03_01720 [Bacilli bacterium]|nr:hypothetical protein [Bacilli bacterium]
MQQKLEELKMSVQKSLKDMDIIVDNVTLEKNGNYKFLTITLDKVNGIDLDTIVEATNIINPIVDKWDMIDDEFILDVISKERNDLNE